MTELTGDQIAQAAGAYAGKPYVMGGATPAGWDCSGFMNWLLNIHLSLPIPGEAPGTNVPHGPVVSSWIQWSGCTTITSPEPGDLIAWGPNQHIGMVTGASEMISALNEQMGTVATSFTGGAADGAPVFLRLADITPGTGSATSGSGSGSGGSSSTDATATGGLDAADTQMLVSAGCLPGSWLIYMILMKGQSWTSRHRWPRARTHR